MIHIVYRVMVHDPVQYGRVGGFDICARAYISYSNLQIKRVNGLKLKHIYEFNNFIMLFMKLKRL